MSSRYKHPLIICIILFGRANTATAFPQSQNITQTHGISELELDTLIHKCNVTTTANGTLALKRLTAPNVQISNVYRRQELLSHFLKESKKRENIVHALHAISQYDSSAQRYNLNEVDELFVNARNLYHSPLPINIDNSPTRLSALYWINVVGPSTLTILSALIERYHQSRTRYIRWIGTDDIPSQETTSLYSCFKEEVGINNLGNRINFFSTPHVNTLEQINRAARDATWRNQMLDSPDSTAGDRANCLMAAFAREHLGQVPEEESNISIIQQFRKDSWWEYFKALESTLSYINPVYPLVKIGAFFMMANNTRLRTQRHIAFEHALWKHVTTLSQWAEAVEHLVTLVSEEAGMWHEAQTLLDIMKDEEVEQFFAATHAFNTGITKKLKWMHNPGQVLYVHRCAEKAAKKIEKIIDQIGVIDAWMSIAHIIQRYNLCQAQFIESDHATVQATQLWSLLLEQENAVKNDVHLGKHSNKMLITGPNGGGKSTVMKAVGQAVMLAQSWGFAPADSFTLTPFHSIFVAMDSQQSISANLSTYMSELHTLNQIVLLAEKEKKHKNHSLVLLDEPCRGSLEIEAAARINGFCTDIDRYSNITVLIATHLYTPALEVQKLSSWSNSQLGYLFSDDTVKRTFALLPGIAHWWFNDIEKRTQFLNHLSQTVLEHSLTSGQKTLFN